MDIQRRRFFSIFAVRHYSGFEFDTQLLDELIGYDSRRILPIVGMGGVGKTTLTKNVYENSLVVYHFDVRTVSQAYNANHMLSQAL